MKNGKLKIENVKLWSRFVATAIILHFTFYILHSSAATSPKNDEVVVQTLLDDGSTNTWTQADLVAALQLMNRRYHRDCENPKGREAWHGKLVGQTVVTNGETMVKTERYADGTSFTFPARVIKPLDSVKAANAKLPKSAMTNGVPVRLANARLRQRANAATTNDVSVTIKAGGSL